MISLDHAYEIRDLVTGRLEEDLFGGDFDAELTEPPLSRFIAGILYPDREDLSPDLPDSVEQHSEEGQEQEIRPSAQDNVADPGISLSHARRPRSMGLTFAVNGDGHAAVRVTVTAHRYEELHDGRWRRIGPRTWDLDLDCSDPSCGGRTIENGLDLRWVVRESRDHVVSVTLSLVNTALAPSGHQDAKCWFCPSLRVAAAPGVLRERPERVPAGPDEAENRTQSLLFRDVRSYGAGHGCAVRWRTDATGAVVLLSTTFMPRHELLLSAPLGNDAVLRMKDLANSEDVSTLDGLVDGYEAWIDRLNDDTTLTTDQRQTLRRHVDEAREAAGRMRTGIDLLRTDPVVLQAFRLMNEAMAEQRSRQDHHRRGGIGDPPSTGAGSWRPFQMAFILLNLSGLADPSHEDRDIADLLWFPTGGGKTEAYLGIIGLAILLRRIRTPDSGGVSVLMRYTLRLLTLQQYQRAAGLICALEKLRQRDLRRSQPISIGLWVGQASTPNTVVDARKILERTRRGTAPNEDEDSSDPVQLRQCPWCGTPLDHSAYEIVGRSLMMRVSCPRPACAYRNGLPVHILDEDIYRERPSLLISTVDKFAMLPWKSEVGELLGSAHQNPDDLPPDLVVQDELHLISGPLGTVVGLYETAVDALCNRNHRPKVVASTATIRRATDQVRAVFARRTRQFPPPGLSHRDSYFAVEAPREDKATRLYTGLMAPGTSHATLMVRVYASLLQSASVVPESDESTDLFWTLLGYFNSLRVLGGAYIQVLDDVPDQMRVVAGRRGEPVRSRPEILEMTSRMRSTQVAESLKRLEQRRGQADAADVVLATNMISVGVDVDRLGLMVMMGQPQTSSEYIQATSRVGRQMPGLVVTLYNAFRSRDLSHYEDFTTYHRAVYRHVEATSATPFAPRARDRALHAVLVALARHRIEGADGSKCAGDAHHWADDLQRCRNLVLRRAEAVRPPGEIGPEDESQKRIGEQLDELISRWIGADLTHYEGWFGRHRKALLVDTSRGTGPDDAQICFPPDDPPWPTMISMREVDAESMVYLVNRRRSSR
jgi:hypothetical protein